MTPLLTAAHIQAVLGTSLPLTAYSALLAITLYVALDEILRI